MPRLDITRTTLRALGHYHALLDCCDRIGKIARARARVLRGQWSAFGMEPARRSPLLGRHVFHGLILTPRAENAVNHGLRPEQADLLLHAGVLLAPTLALDGVGIRNPQMPELQVGLWMALAVTDASAHADALSALLDALREAAYDVDDQVVADPDAVDLRVIVAVRRLSLASLQDEDSPGAAAGRFFASALKPLEMLEDATIETLLIATGHGDVYERQLPV
jgi:hypothetical protein